MKVADSSYLVQGILRDAALLERDTLLSPDLALFEVVNTLWKHETLIRDLEDAKERIEILSELISSEHLQLIRPDKQLLNEAYMVSIKHRLPIYDSIYIALALQLKMKLATYDTKQSAIMRQEETTRAAQTLDQRP